MGSFNSCDVLTGLGLEHGEKVVAFVVDQTRGGYPAAETTITKSSRMFGDICRIVSLPIHARLGDCGGIEPLAGQVGAEAACRMFGKEDWDEVEKGPLNWQVGGRIRQPAFNRKIFGDAEGPDRCYGLAIVSAASWKHLMGFTGRYMSRAKDVDAVAKLFFEAAAVMLEPSSADRKHDKERDLKVYNAINMLGLSVSQVIGSDRELVQLPALSSLLDSSRDLFGPDFITWFRSEEGLAGSHNADAIAANPEAFREVLRSLWDTHAFCIAMKAHHRTLLSSGSIGQYSGDIHQVELSLVTLKQAASRVAGRHGEDPGNQMEALVGLLGRMGDLHQSLIGRVSGLMAASAARDAEIEAGGPGGP